MEEELDKIEEGELGWRACSKDFYGPFAKSLKTCTIRGADRRGARPVARS